MSNILSALDKIVPWLSGTTGVSALVFLFFMVRARVRRILVRVFIVAAVVLVLWLILSPASPITVSLRN